MLVDPPELHHARLPKGSLKHLGTVTNNLKDRTGMCAGELLSHAISERLISGKIVIYLGIMSCSCFPVIIGTVLMFIGILPGIPAWPGEPPSPFRPGEPG